MRSLNPGVKLLALVVASLVLSVTFNTRVNVAVAALALVTTALTPRVNRKALACALVPFALTAAALFMTGLLYGAGGGAEAGASVSSDFFGQRTLFASDWSTAGQLASRVLAYGGLGMVFAFTTDAFELVMSLMQQFRLPAKFAYGVLAAYHFFPTVRSECQSVGVALRVRGVRVGPLSSRRVVPMLAHALERSEALAMAMESRGFEGDAPRRVAFEVPLRARDLVFAVGLNVAIVAALLLV